MAEAKKDTSLNKRRQIDRSGRVMFGWVAGAAGLGCFVAGSWGGGLLVLPPHGPTPPSLAPREGEGAAGRPRSGSVGLGAAVEAFSGPSEPPRTADVTVSLPTEQNRDRFVIMDHRNPAEFR